MKSLFESLSLAADLNSSVGPESIKTIMTIIKSNFESVRGMMAEVQATQSYI